MATPTINSYLLSTPTGLTSSDGYVCAMYGSTLYIYAYGSSKMNRLLGNGTLNSGIYAGGLSCNSQGKAMGISPDGSTIILANNGTFNTFMSFDTSTGAMVTYTGSVSPSAQFTGNIYVQNNTTFYCCSSNGTASRNPIKVVLNTSNSTYTWSDQCQNAPNISGCYGCTLFGTDDLYFINTDGTTWGLFRCSLTTQGQVPTQVSVSGVGINSIKPLDVFAINGLNANSTTYNFIFLGESVTNTLRQYTISGTTASQVGARIPGNNIISSICGSVSSGNQSGNMRIFAVSGVPNSTHLITKLYNGGGTTGPTGVSTGGDPHTGTLTGKSVIIVRDTPFEYLDTHPLRGNKIFEEGEKIRTYIECDCFSLKGEKDHFSDQLEEDHYRELITNLDDSYLKYVTFIFGNISKKINMITLLLSEEGEADGKGKLQKNKGKEQTFEVESGENKGKIYFSEIEFFTEGSVELKSKYSRKTAYAKREIQIITEEYSLSFQLTRTKCIHLSDVYLEIEGESDPFTFGGVIVDGEVKSPIHFEKE